MALSRRDLIRSGFVVGGAVALGGRPGSAWALPDLASPKFTTLQSTYGKGAPGAGGYRPVVLQAGEPHVVRTDLGAGAGSRRASKRKALLSVRASHRRARPRRPVAGTRRVGRSLRRQVQRERPDHRALHVLLPAAGDPHLAGRRSHGPSDQPDRARSRHRSEAVVRHPDRRQRRQLPAATRSAGTSTSSTARSLTPDSGSRTAYEGVAARKNYDAHYWHPEPGAGQPAGHLYHTEFGFPDVEGLLEAATRTFDPVGLNIPWYSVFGNHDGLVQGNFPGTIQLDWSRPGKLKLTTVPPGLLAGRRQTAFEGRPQPPARRGSTSVRRRRDARTSSAGPVPQAGRRRALQHHRHPGRPRVHRRPTGLQGTAYYTFDHGAPCAASCSTRSTRTGTPTARSTRSPVRRGSSTCWRRPPTGT